MMIQPLFDNLHVKVIQEGESEDGIVDTRSPDRPQRGKVVSRGPDCSAVSESDEVLFKSYSPDIVTIGGQEVTLLSEKDVLAIVRP